MSPKLSCVSTLYSWPFLFNATNRIVVGSATYNDQTRIHTYTVTWTMQPGEMLCGELQKSCRFACTYNVHTLEYILLRYPKQNIQFRARGYQTNLGILVPLFFNLWGRVRMIFSDGDAKNFGENQFCLKEYMHISFLL